MIEKYSRKIVFFSLLLFVGCSTPKKEVVYDIDEVIQSPVDSEKFQYNFNEIEHEKLKLSVEHFQKLVEWALLLRTKSILLSESLQLKKENNQPFSGRDLDILLYGIKEYLLLRQEILKVVDNFKNPNLQYNLLDSDLRLMSDMLALAGALVLYDNFAIAVMPYQNDRNLRKLVNRGDKGFSLESNRLKFISKNYYSKKNRKNVLETLIKIQGNRDWIDRNKKKNKTVAYLDELISQSPSIHTLQSKNIVNKYTNYMSLFTFQGKDSIDNLQESSFNEVSKIFGNTIGLVQFRRGYLYKNEDIAQSLKENLKPLDILLDQTPFRLTAKFIPGYFGHVAIWTGSPDELKEMGLWEHPVIKPYQEEISQGKRIIEALRDGVQLNTLEHFMDVDDIAILRVSKKNDIHKTKNTIIRAFRQLGKKYDFNFDVETTDKIVCSELAYMVFTDIKWTTSTILWRNTISPDNVAQLAIGENKKLNIIKFYKDGKEVKENIKQVYKSCLH